MKLIIQNNRIAATATDEYTGPDEYIDAPADFDVTRLGEYRYEDGAMVLTLPVEPISEKIEALWQAADRYVTGYISGVAIGILTIGVIQGKPKALAVTAWSNAVWSDYYVRKALVEGGAVPNLDFSTHGPIPHTVPELQDEIGL